MTRQEHLNWSKARALKYLDSNDIKNAIASMLSDLSKHEGTKDHPAILLMGMLVRTENLETEKQVRDFIKGFS